MQTGPPGAFTDGGNPIRKGGDTLQTYEPRNLTTTNVAEHTVLFGGRFRQRLDAKPSMLGFNCAFTFPTLDADYGCGVVGIRQS